MQKQIKSLKNQTTPTLALIDIKTKWQKKSLACQTSYREGTTFQFLFFRTMHFVEKY